MCKFWELSCFINPCRTAIKVFPYKHIFAYSHKKAKFRSKAYTHGSDAWRSAVSAIARRALDEKSDKKSSVYRSGSGRGGDC